MRARTPRLVVAALTLALLVSCGGGQEPTEVPEAAATTPDLAALDGIGWTCVRWPGDKRPDSRYTICGRVTGDNAAWLELVGSLDRTLRYKVVTASLHGKQVDQLHAFNSRVAASTVSLLDPGAGQLAATLKQPSLWSGDVPDAETTHYTYAVARAPAQKAGATTGPSRIALGAKVIGRSPRVDLRSAGPAVDLETVSAALPAAGFSCDLEPDDSGTALSCTPGKKARPRGTSVHLHVDDDGLLDGAELTAPADAAYRQLVQTLTGIGDPGLQEYSQALPKDGRMTRVVAAAEVLTLMSVDRGSVRVQAAATAARFAF